MASLSKWLRVRLQTKWFWVWVPLQSHFLVFVFAANDCVSISEFVLLGGVPVGIASSKVGIKNFGSTAGIKNSRLVMKRVIEVLISKVLTD